jgi:hypothetical protein
VQRTSYTAAVLQWSSTLRLVDHSSDGEKLPVHPSRRMFHTGNKFVRDCLVPDSTAHHMMLWCIFRGKYFSRKGWHLKRPTLRTMIQPQAELLVRATEYCTMHIRDMLHKKILYKRQRGMFCSERLCHLKSVIMATNHACMVCQVLISSVDRMPGKSVLCPVFKQIDTHNMKICPILHNEMPSEK